MFCAISSARMHLFSLWILLIISGFCSALMQPRLTAPETTDARGAFLVQCHYGTLLQPSQNADVDQTFEADPQRQLSKGPIEERVGESHEAIQSLKIYVGAAEVFRFAPSAVPQTSQFAAAGGALVERASCAGAGCDVRLRAPAGAHAVRCDLSAEGPTFDIVSSTAVVHVIAEPVYGPTIVGAPGGVSAGDVLLLNCSTDLAAPPAHYARTLDAEPVYGPTIVGAPGGVSAGDVLLLNCSTDLAAPPAHVTWTLDGRQVDNRSMSNVSWGPPDELGLRKSWRGARIAVPPGDADVRVACVAAQPAPAPPRERRAVLLVRRMTEPQLSKYTAASTAVSGAASALTTLWIVLTSQLLDVR